MIAHEVLNLRNACDVSWRMRTDLSLRFVAGGPANPLIWWALEGLVLLRRYIGAAWPPAWLPPMVGWKRRPATQVASDASASFGGDNVYWLYPESFGRGGVAAPADPLLLQPAVYASGAYVGAVPNAPVYVEVAQIAGPKARVKWIYNPLNQQAVPASFDVFKDDGAGAINLGAVVANIAYVDGQTRYAWTSGTLSDGAFRAYTVRAKTAGGVYSLLPSQSDAFRGLHAAYGSLPASHAAALVADGGAPADPDVPTFS